VRAAISTLRNPGTGFASFLLRRGQFPERNHPRDWVIQSTPPSPAFTGCETISTALFAPRLGSPSLGEDCSAFPADETPFHRFPGIQGGPNPPTFLLASAKRPRFERSTQEEWEESQETLLFGVVFGTSSTAHRVPTPVRPRSSVEAAPSSGNPSSSCRPERESHP